MISMLLDRAALLRTPIVFTNMQLKNALSYSAQFKFWDGCTSVGPAAVYAARSTSVRNLFIFLSSNHVVTEWNTERQWSKTKQTTPRKIFGTKCDLALRRLNLYRCAPCRTLLGIPTLDETTTRRMTTRNDETNDSSLQVNAVSHLPRELSSIIFKQTNDYMKRRHRLGGPRSRSP